MPDSTKHGPTRVPPGPRTANVRRGDRSGPERNLGAQAMHPTRSLESRIIPYLDALVARVKLLEHTTVKRKGKPQGDANQQQIELNFSGRLGPRRKRS